MKECCKNTQERILEIIDKWDDGSDTDVDELKSKITEQSPLQLDKSRQTEDGNSDTAEKVIPSNKKTSADTFKEEKK